MAQHDPLTDLPNRTLFHDRMEMELARAQRSESILGLLMVDLDGFKGINDTLGHGVGDAVLREVAMRLVYAVRKTDTVARIGGDEFVLLLPDLNHPGEVEAIAAKIASAISMPVRIGNREIALSGSVGGCTYPSGGTDAERLQHCADAAMYRAKAQGRNRYFISGHQSFRPG
jgi:diguanylate cyclase (GGDEF)-like protein